MSYGKPCEDCQKCGGCDRVAFCLSEPGFRPCSHDQILCEDCRLHPDHGCHECRLEAEHDMYVTGEYDERKDPFLNHTVDPAVYEARTALWLKESGFDPIQNRRTHRDAS